MEKITEVIEVSNSHGLHVRPASIFVQIASKYDSSVQLEKDGEAVDGKSIIAILSLGINRGMKVNLVVDGVDAHEAFEELKNFLVSGND
jgi:phosphocarrier protein HPr